MSFYMLETPDWFLDYTGDINSDFVFCPGEVLELCAFPGNK